MEPTPSKTGVLIGERLRDDPRVAEAKRLLREAVSEHAASLVGVREPQAERAAAYRTLLEELGAARGGAPWFPYLAAGIGRGPWVELADGSVKLDFIAGIGVHGMGHSHPEVIDAAVDAAIEDVVMQGNLQQHPPSLRLCQRLLEIARRGPANLAHCLLSTSGAMANENALKIAFHARQPADRILALDHCFAGRTLALASLTDRAKYREGLPEAVRVDYLPLYDARDPAGSTRRAVDRLHDYLRRYPGRHAAVWLELVTGEGGYYAGSREFFESLLEPLRKAGVVVIFDEVQSFGRLSQPFAFQHFGLDASVDIVTVGKITQVCATLYRTELKPTAPILSQTFTGASASIAAAMAVLDGLEEAGCFGPEGRNLQRHEYFARQMEAIAGRLPGKVAGPWGAGMMMALTPGDGSMETARRVVLQCYERGLICFLAGGDPYRVRFLPPPAVTTETEIDAALAILEPVLAEL